jgi:8-oxo-dGTP diphosphatase
LVREVPVGYDRVMTETKPRREHPIVGVGAVIFNGAGEVLLIRRGKPPLHREWSIPGGSVEHGEKLTDALTREVREETGLEIEIVGLIDVLDAIIPDPVGQRTLHYVLIDYASHATGGELKAGSDATDAAWVPVARLDDYSLWSETRRVILMAIAAAAL